MGIVLPMSTPDTHRYLSVQQAAERVGVHPKTVRRWIAAGHLTAYRVGPRLIRVNPDDLDAMVGRAA